jgi:diguanylate cyclase (GGDEF)-like protein
MQKILIVDDVPANIKMLGELLREHYEIFVTNNGSKAVQIAEAILPDLILLDVVMPEMDGFSACTILKGISKTAEIPVIFITAKNESEDIVKGFEVGGIDYITKPFNPAEVNARVKTHIELRKTREELRNYTQRLESLNKELCLKNIQLNEAYDDLRVAAMTDPLTGLANRRHMIAKIEEEIVRFKRNKTIFSFILCDIDNFKAINDQYGHEQGDYILKVIAESMKSTIREQDIVSRWGGEEFLLLLTETDKEGASVAAEKLRSKIEALEIVCNEKRVKVTMTFGVAVFSQEDGIDSTIKKADDALYLGKGKGKNCVVSINK